MSEYKVEDCRWVPGEMELLARRLREEREMWHELVGQLVACHEDETCPAVAWAKNVLSDTDAQFAEWLAGKED